MKKTEIDEFLYILQHEKQKLFEAFSDLKVIHIRINESIYRIQREVVQSESIRINA